MSRPDESDSDVLVRIAEETRGADRLGGGSASSRRIVDTRLSALSATGRPRPACTLKYAAPRSY
jgi:hypothetical protein